MRVRPKARAAPVREVLVVGVVAAEVKAGGVEAVAAKEAVECALISRLNDQRLLYLGTGLPVDLSSIAGVRTQLWEA